MTIMPPSVPSGSSPDSRELVFLLIGSNEGDRQQWIHWAVQEIQAHIGPIARKSRIYETAAWGKENQPDFLNMALALRTSLSPLDLLKKVQDIEQRGGRQRTELWGQRTLDLDILFIGDQILQSPYLEVPHPAMADRRFVLAPLAEIAPELIHPQRGISVSQMLADCPDPLPVRIHRLVIP